jgi:hypothetical protein
MEHTTEEYEARKIARDHLAENPDYYKYYKKGKGKEYLVSEYDMDEKGRPILKEEKKQPAPFQSYKGKRGYDVDVTGQIIDYEDGKLDDAETLYLFSHLYASGMIRSLQGSYGRTGQALIDDGFLKSNGELTDKAKDFIAEQEATARFEKSKTASRAEMYHYDINKNKAAKRKRRMPKGGKQANWG